MKIPIDQITIGDRFRKEMGDLNALAASIIEQGLLQPIGITEDRVLVFGERRLLACRDILHRTEIEATTVNVTSIVEGEYAENEIREKFRPSEQLAIFKAVKAELDKRGERRGRPSEIPIGRSELNKGKETRELAAKMTGLSASTLQRFKAVHDSGDQELIKALDEGKISATAAQHQVRGYAERPSRAKKKKDRPIDPALLPPSLRPKVAKPPKKHPPIEKALDLVLSQIGAQLRTGKFEQIIANKDGLDDWPLQNAAATLRNMAAEMLKYADQLWLESVDEHDRDTSLVEISS